MKEFLYDIATEISAQHHKLEEVTLVFPNRRAIIYFRKHLGSVINKPAFAPSLVTIEDFISKFSLYRVPDKLELVYRLYTSYSEVVKSTEAFDKFYFWGEMLLRDFDDIDKHMVNAEMIFKDLSQQKELDATFDYLTEQQKEFLIDFWGHFDAQKSENKRKFLEVWKQLGNVYKAYREQLKMEKLAYDGMLHREVAEQVQAATDIQKGDTFWSLRVLISVRFASAASILISIER